MACRVALLLAIGVVGFAGCQPNLSKEDQTVGQGGKAKETQKNTAVSKDSVLGKWICLADNVNARPTTTMELRADGTAVIEDQKDLLKKTILRYRTESSTDWLARRTQGDPKSSEALKSAGWLPAGSLMVEFADPKTGEFIDWGGMLLIFDPKNQILANPITQLWCRPGQEERVRALSGMTAREQEMDARAARLKKWRPKIDVTGRWKAIWKVDFADNEKWQYWVCSGDLNGDGVPEVVTSSDAGFEIFDANGRRIRGVKTTEHGDRFLALGRNNGTSIIAQFGTWGQEVLAYDPKGKHVWTYSPEGEPGIDWVAPLRIDERNTGFVIGYNGGAGVDLIGPDGIRLWHAAVDTNVWNVASARLSRGLPESAVSVGAESGLVFDSRGKASLRFGGPEGEVGAEDVDGDGIDELLTLGTTVSSGQKLTVFDSQGRRIWGTGVKEVDVAFVKGKPFISGSFGGKQLLGVATGMTITFFEPDGKEFGTFVTQDGIQAVDVMRRKVKSDALLVRVNGQLSCYEMR